MTARTQVLIAIVVADSSSSSSSSSSPSFFMIVHHHRHHTLRVYGVDTFEIVYFLIENNMKLT